MLTVVHGLNDVVAFALELAVYAAVAYWGLTCGSRWPLRLLAGVGVLLLFILVWAVFGAPTAAYPVHGAGRALLEVVWFGGGALALIARRRRRLAAAFIIVYLLSTLAQWL